MEYWYKPAPEAIRFMFVAVVTVLLTTIVTTDFSTITDWPAWLLGAGVAAIQAAASAILASLGSGGFTSDGKSRN